MSEALGVCGSEYGERATTTFSSRVPGLDSNRDWLYISLLGEPGLKAEFRIGALSLLGETFCRPPAKAEGGSDTGRPCPGLELIFGSEGVEDSDTIDLSEEWIDDSADLLVTDDF